MPRKFSFLGWSVELKVNLGVYAQLCPPSHSSLLLELAPHPPDPPPHPARVSDTVPDDQICQPPDREAESRDYRLELQGKSSGGLMGKVLLPHYKVMLTQEDMSLFSGQMLLHL